MHEMLQLIGEMSPFLLLGFFLAGIMHAFVPNTLYGKYLSANNLRSVVYATLFGIPLPLCSCGVIPTAMALRRDGASKGATVAFLIATPQTGVDSIIATYSLMGLPFAIIRPIAAFITAMVGGTLCNLTSNDEVVSVSAPTWSKAQKAASLGFGAKLRLALRYGFVDMMQDIGKWLAFGLLVAGVITILVPDSFFFYFKDSTTLSILFVLIFMLPMYLCATGSIPIAVALMLKGISPGAALLLLMVGPACNLASLLIVGKVMGRRTLAMYVLAIVLTAVGFAYAVDFLMPREWFTSALVNLHTCHHEHLDWFSLGCTIVLALLLLNAFWLRHKHHGCGCHHDGADCGCGQHDSDCHCHDHACTCHDSACLCHEEASKVTVYKVEGLHCNHCRINAEKVVKELPGVVGVSVELTKKTMTVQGTVAAEEVKRALSAIGFEVVSVEE